MTNLRMNQFYKTKTCPWYYKGRCERGEACRFAHSDTEKRNLPDLSRTSLCAVLVKHGTCTAPNCRFAHHVDQLRATDDMYKTSLCFMFMKSRCEAGSQCRHAHGTHELRAAPSQSNSEQMLSGAGILTPTALGSVEYPCGTYIQNQYDRDKIKQSESYNSLQRHHLEEWNQGKKHSLILTNSSNEPFQNFPYNTLEGFDNQELYNKEIRGETDILHHYQQPHNYHGILKGSHIKQLEPTHHFNGTTLTQGLPQLSLKNHITHDFLLSSSEETIDPMLKPYTASKQFDLGQEKSVSYNHNITKTRTADGLTTHIPCSLPASSDTATQNSHSLSTVQSQQQQQQHSTSETYNGLYIMNAQCPYPNKKQTNSLIDPKVTEEQNGYLTSIPSLNIKPYNKKTHQSNIIPPCFFSYIDNSNQMVFSQNHSTFPCEPIISQSTCSSQFPEQHLNTSDNYSEPSFHLSSSITHMMPMQHSIARSDNSTLLNSSSIMIQPSNSASQSSLPTVLLSSSITPNEHVPSTPLYMTSPELLHHDKVWTTHRVNPIDQGLSHMSQHLNSTHLSGIEDYPNRSSSIELSNHTDQIHHVSLSLDSLKGNHFSSVSSETIRPVPNTQTIENTINGYRDESYSSTTSTLQKSPVLDQLSPLKQTFQSSFQLEINSQSLEGSESDTRRISWDCPVEWNIIESQTSSTTQDQENLNSVSTEHPATTTCQLLLNPENSIPIQDISETLALSSRHYSTSQNAPIKPTFSTTQQQTTHDTTHDNIHTLLENISVPSTNDHHTHMVYGYMKQLNPNTLLHSSSQKNDITCLPSEPSLFLNEFHSTWLKNKVSQTSSAVSPFLSISHPNYAHYCSSDAVLHYPFQGKDTLVEEKNKRSESLHQKENHSTTIMCSQDIQTNEQTLFRDITHSEHHSLNNDDPSSSHYLTIQADTDQSTAYHDHDNSYNNNNNETVFLNNHSKNCFMLFGNEQTPSKQLGHCLQHSIELNQKHPQYLEHPWTDSLTFLSKMNYPDSSKQHLLSQSIPDRCLMASGTSISTCSPCTSSPLPSPTAKIETFIETGHHLQQTDYTQVKEHLKHSDTLYQFGTTNRLVTNDRTDSSHLYTTNGCRNHHIPTNNLILKDSQMIPSMTLPDMNEDPIYPIDTIGDDTLDNTTPMITTKSNECVLFEAHIIKHHNTFHENHHTDIVSGFLRESGIATASTTTTTTPTGGESRLNRLNFPYLNVNDKSYMNEITRSQKDMVLKEDISRSTTLPSIPRTSDNLFDLWWSTRQDLQHCSSLVSTNIQEKQKLPSSSSLITDCFTPKLHPIYYDLNEKTSENQTYSHHIDDDPRLCHPVNKKNPSQLYDHPIVSPIQGLKDISSPSGVTPVWLVGQAAAAAMTSPAEVWGSRCIDLPSPDDPIVYHHLNDNMINHSNRRSSEIILHQEPDPDRFQSIRRTSVQ